METEIVSAVKDRRNDPFEYVSVIYPEGGSDLVTRLRNALHAESISPNGIQFSTLPQFCREWLMSSDKIVTDDPLSRRKVALESLIHGNLPELSYFDPEQLREGPGYAEALGANIRECERNGLTYDDLLSADENRLQDLGKIWKRVDISLGWAIENNSNNETVSPGQTLQVVRDVSPPVPGHIESVLAIADRPTHLEEQVYEQISSAIEFVGYQLTTPISMPRSLHSIHERMRTPHPGC